MESGNVIDNRPTADIVVCMVSVHVLLGWSGRSVGANANDDNNPALLAGSGTG
jgi:hypothetical protein